MVDSGSIKDNWNNTWDGLFLPLNVHNNNWILIAADKCLKKDI
jgi:hypothetical protein